MKVLHVVAGLPTKERPFHQPFIKSQIDSLKKENLEIGVIEIKGYNSKFSYLKAIKEIRSEVIKENYNIIHAHYSYCGLISYLAKTGKPIILSLMGSDLIGKRDKKGRINLRGNFDKLLTKFTIDKMNYIIVKSEKMKGLLNTFVPTAIIPNGVDLKLFKTEDIQVARRKLGINETDFVILFLGSKNNIVKNFKLADDSVKVFKNKMQTEKITFLNPYGMGHQEVVNYMNASNVLLLTSFYEGSPNIIKEAMACNLPIISVDVGDVKQVVNDSYNCFIVEYSISGICQKLETIYNNKRRSNGRENIFELSSEKIAERIINTYKEIIKN